MKLLYKSREVEAILSFEKYEEDCYFYQAHYVDDGTELNDEELDQLTSENYAVINEAYSEYLQCAAEFFLESLEDR